MNSILTAKDWLNLFRCICVATWAAAIGAATQPVFGQFENDFAGNSQRFQDSAVVPADFQREIHGVVDDLDDQATPSGIGDGIKQYTDSNFAGDHTTSLVNGFKSQVSDLDLPRVFGSLAIVLGGYFSLVWLTRRFGSRGTGKLPNEVVEVLGQTPFKPGYNLQLIRLGNKLLLLMNSAEGTHTIGEISDPEEVARLCMKCGVAKPMSKPAPIHVPKSPAASRPGKAPDTDLKKILRQLQRVAEDDGNGAVFEA